MKIIAILLIALSLISFTPKDPVRIVFFGDSITQAGVNPKGYVTRIQEYINRKYPGEFVTVGAGIGGNKVYDLYLRLDKMLELKPDVVVIYIGVNDIWHKTSHGTGTDPDKFIAFYQRIIDELKERNIKVVLATPAVIGERPDNSNPQDGDLNYYSNIIRKLASENDLSLVDLRKAFLEYNLKNNPENNEKGILTNDRVHLNELGNNFVAEEMIKVLFE